VIAPLEGADPAKDTDGRTKAFFRARWRRSARTGYDLSINRYKEVAHEEAAFERRWTYHIACVRWNRTSLGTWTISRGCFIDRRAHGSDLRVVGEAAPGPARVRAPESRSGTSTISSIDATEKRVVAVSTIATLGCPEQGSSALQSGDVLVFNRPPELNAVAIVPDELHGGDCVLQDSLCCRRIMRRSSLDTSTTGFAPYCLVRAISRAPPAPATQRN